MNPLATSLAAAVPLWAARFCKEPLAEVLAPAAIAERLASRADAPKSDGGPRFRIKRTVGAPAGRIATSNSGADPC